METVRIPLEPFIMQTVFESETTLQHPYESKAWVKQHYNEFIDALNTL